MLKILTMASAFVGIIVGAGFASGQEVLQYFTSFGHLGSIGIILSTLLFAYCGMMLTQIGCRLKVTSHREAISLMGGRYISTLVDYIIVLTLFGVGVVMIAGAGSLLYQQFNLPYFIGNALMTLLVMITLMLRIEKVIIAIGMMTPFLIGALIIICLYSLATMEASFSELEPIALSVKRTLPNWFISAINYVSFNVAVGAGMALVMGGVEQNEKSAQLGGLIGGLLVGLLLFIAHLAIFSKIKSVADMDMPLLKIVDDASPTLAIIMTLIISGMIYNTAVSMYYAFIARYVPMNTIQSKRAIIGVCFIGFIASFAGFKELVAYFYPLIGYTGLLLIGMLLYAPIKLKTLARPELSVN